MIDSESHRILIHWFADHGRIYPWRVNHDPYLVLMAVFMLQRTGVSQVMNVYPTFASRYPDFSALSAADPAELAVLIRPLGRLNRLAQLLALIKAIASEHGGNIPADLKALESLPGLGQYCARSVMCMAYGRPYIMLDPNSYRVVCRAWGFKSTKARPHTDKDLIMRLDTEVPVSNPREFNLALLDIGSQICRERRPRHQECPLIRRCPHYMESD